MLKEKVHSAKIIYLIYLTQRIRDECGKIVGNETLLCHVHENVVKRTNICIANDGQHIEDAI